MHIADAHNLWRAHCRFHFAADVEAAETAHPKGCRSCTGELRMGDGRGLPAVAACIETAELGVEAIPGYGLIEVVALLHEPVAAADGIEEYVAVHSAGSPYHAVVCPCRASGECQRVAQRVGGGGQRCAPACAEGDAFAAGVYCAVAGIGVEAAPDI